MKRILKEQLERIHRLNYGNKVISEGFLDSLIGSKESDKKKADTVEPNVQKFFQTLETASQGNGITQQEKGSMTFQKEVETMQIGLILLGYDLPIYGVDGLFGPETARAVKKFKIDNEILNEDAGDIRATLDSLGYDEKGNELTSGGDISNQLSALISKILRDFKEVEPNVKIVVTAGNDKYHQKLSYNSKHSTGEAVDLVLQPYNQKSASKFTDILEKYKSTNTSFDYIDEYKNPSTSATGGHFHLQYGDNVPTSKVITTETATPEMLSKLIELLKNRGVKSQEIDQYSNLNVIDYSGNTDNELYIKLLEVLGAPVSEENLKFIYAWRQAEGKGGKNNPFNTTWNLIGSTVFNKAGVRNYLTPQDGLSATVKTLRNGNYDCIVNGLRNDIGADKIATCESLKTWGTGDLVSKVLMAYKSGAKPKIASLS